MILAIVDLLIKIVYYKVFKILINTLRLLEVIINIVVRYYSLSKSNNQQLRLVIKFEILVFIELLYWY